MAQCCNPIPPEPIIGYITRGYGVTIHRRNCSQVENLSEPERLIEVAWGIEEDGYPIPIIVRGYSRPGLMNDITNMLKGRGIGLIKAKSATADGVASIHLVVEVTNLSDLDWLLRKLETLPNVIEAQRQRWTG
jgi:GTP pyrophosphokinase